MTDEKAYKNEKIWLRKAKIDIKKPASIMPAGNNKNYSEVEMASWQRFRSDRSGSASFHGR